ncbi:MAG: GH3 auxin-responsive promoter family protein [Bacteroidales bacterium]
MAILGTIIKNAYALRNIPLEKRRKFDGWRAQKKILRKFLKKAQNTAFGEHYRFQEILRSPDIVASFQERVPTHDYQSMFQQWWYRSLNGEAFVTWPGRVKYFALTSGTSEASSKHIPVTGDMIRAIRRTSIRQLVSTVKYDFPIEFYEKGILMIGGSTHLQFNGSYYEGDLSGISAGNLPFWFQHFYKPGKRISRERDWETKLQEIVKKSVNWDIGVIVGVPAWIQIIMERIIEHYNVETIHDIWPNLSVYVHSGVAFDPYIKSFERLFGKRVIFNESYLASEGYIAYQNRLDVRAMKMVMDNGLFYEFVPFNDENFDTEGNMKEGPQTCTLNEIEENKEYALLLTTCSGAWRYLIGDTIKFTSKAHNEIVITGRTKHFLSICGEHLSQDNMNRAIKMLQDEFNIEVREWTVSGIRYDSMFAHKWFIGTDSQIDPETARGKIDEYLKTLNDDYRVERIAAIKEIFVEVLPTSVFAKWMKIHGKEGGANKFPRVLKNKQLQEWEKFIQEFNK